MTELPGQPWPVVASLGDDRARLRGELGRIVAGLHAVTGSGFGYPAQSLAASWREYSAASHEWLKRQVVPALAAELDLLRT